MDTDEIEIEITSLIWSSFPRLKTDLGSQVNRCESAEAKSLPPSLSIAV